MTSVWQIEHHLAHLKLSWLEASLDLRRPSQGLSHLATDEPDKLWPEARLLAVQVPSLSEANPGMLQESHRRGADLVATYQPSDTWPVGVDVMWRAWDSDVFGAAAATIEVVVSVCTQRLDSHPELSVVSLLPDTEVARLVDVETPRYEPVGGSSHYGPAILEAIQGPGCLLFRPRAAELSYAEMVFPSDFGRDELSSRREAPAWREIRHRLFPKSLEKGVILRARVRGVFVPRGDDEQLVARCYASFAAEDPLLGT